MGGERLRGGCDGGVREIERGKQRDREKGEGTGGERGRLPSALSPPPARPFSLLGKHTLGSGPLAWDPKGPCLTSGKGQCGTPRPGGGSRLPRGWEVSFPLPGRGGYIMGGEGSLLPTLLSALWSIPPAPNAVTGAMEENAPCVCSMSWPARGSVLTLLTLFTCSLRARPFPLLVCLFTCTSALPIPATTL